MGLRHDVIHRAIVDPTVNDDSSVLEGTSSKYKIGDDWLNTVTDEVFEVFDLSVGAALWENVTKSYQGLKAYFLDAQGAFGTGGGWADSGLINDLPVVLYASNLTEKAVFMHYGLSAFVLDTINPTIAFTVISTVAPAVGLKDVRWQLEARYIAIAESPSKAADETILVTEVLPTNIANTYEELLIFTLDKTKISIGDIIMFTLSRLGGDAADTYVSDVGIGQSGMVVESRNFNP